MRTTLVVPLALLLVACGPSLPTSAPAPVAVTSSVTSTTPTAGSGAPVLDPCQQLTKADAQPFFTAQVVTELPAIMQSDDEKSCEFQTDHGSSSLIVDYLVGDGAQTKLLLNQQGVHDSVAVPGVGDGANHPTGGDPTMLFSWKGSGSSAVVCTVTTTGLQFTLRTSVTQLTDDQATQIDEQYGTLCNKMYGSGNTSPTVPSVSVAPASSLPADTSAALADSGKTVPGTGIPLPAGVDCSGDKTTTGGLLGLDCETAITDPQGVYQFFLTALPQHGYTINSQAFDPAANGSIANGRIMFTSATDGLCFVSIIGLKLSVSKQTN